MREVEVAERLCGVIPCADKVQFLKTGAGRWRRRGSHQRTYTARDVVIACGYFGWLDWCSEDAAGVPADTQRLTRRVPYDDVAALTAAVSEVGARLAAIVIEPVIERLPSMGWITSARELATSAGAVLIFDEIKTGFRLRTGGYQAMAEVMPDLSAFGKAMANGFPLSVVCGHRDIMDAARKTWISSTLASEGAALAAANAVLTWHDTADVCESLGAIGAEMRNAVTSAVEAAGVEGLTIGGLDQMWTLRWDSPAREQRFLSSPRRMACCSSEARTTLRRSLTTTTQFETSRLARAARWSRCATRKTTSDGCARRIGDRHRAADRRARALLSRRIRPRRLGRRQRGALSRG